MRPPRTHMGRLEGWGWQRGCRGLVAFQIKYRQKMLDFLRGEKAVLHDEAAESPGGVCREG